MRLPIFLLVVLVVLVACGDKVSVDGKCGVSIDTDGDHVTVRTLSPQVHVVPLLLPIAIRVPVVLEAMP